METNDEDEPVRAKDANRARTTGAFTRGSIEASPAWRHVLAGLETELGRLERELQSRRYRRGTRSATDAIGPTRRRSAATIFTTGAIRQTGDRSGKRAAGAVQGEDAGCGTG